jgi:hypothetical protein
MDKRWVRDVTVSRQTVVNGDQVTVSATVAVYEGEVSAAFETAHRVIDDELLRVMEAAAKAAARAVPSVRAPSQTRRVSGGIFHVSTERGKTTVKWSGDRYSKFGLPVWPEVWESAQLTEEDRKEFARTGVLKADNYVIELATLPDGREKVRSVTLRF